eukprot:2756343-Alexandrium_andersonii.AAC.1
MIHEEPHLMTARLREDTVVLAIEVERLRPALLQEEQRRAEDRPRLTPRVEGRWARQLALPPPCLD